MDFSPHVKELARIFHDVVAGFARIQSGIERCLNSGEFSYEHTVAKFPVLVRNSGYDMSTDTALPAAVIAELQESLVLAATGVRDPETMWKAREEMNRMREELRQRNGIVDVAVDLIHDARNQ